MNKMHLNAKQMEADICASLETSPLAALFGSMQDAVSDMKDVVVNTIVSCGYYALIVTLGWWGAIALSNLIGNLFFAAVVLIFGIVVSVALAILAAEVLTPPTIKYGKIAVAFGTEKISSAKSWINSKFASKNEVTA